MRVRSGGVALERWAEPLSRPGDQIMFSGIEGEPWRVSEQGEVGKM